MPEPPITAVPTVTPGDGRGCTADGRGRGRPAAMPDVPRWAEVTVRGHAIPNGARIAGSWVREVHAPKLHGRPVVLLHGLGATAALNWVGAFEPVGRRHRVL